MRARLGALLSCLVLILTIGLAFANPSEADAHGYIIRVIPADRAALTRAPIRIQAWFSEPLEPRFSSLSLANEKGEPIELADSGVPETNRTQLSARIPQKLPDGLYVITMRVAFASDGHVYNERVMFWVGEPSRDIATGATSRGAEPLEVVWRAITLPALATLFGLYVLYAVVLLPAWGNSRYTAGRLPPRVMARLNTIAWIAIIGAGLGTALALVQQSAVLFNVDVLAVVRDNLWSTVLNGTQIGDTLKARFVMIGVVAVLQYAASYAARRLPALVSLVWTANIVIAALALGTISLSSHAAGADLWVLPSVAAHWIHVLANSTWAGGLAALVFALPVALDPLAESERRAGLRAVVRRFALVGAIAVILMAVTGLYNAAIQVRQPGDLVNSGYGLALLAKLALVAPMLLFGLYHHAAASDDRVARVARRVFFGARSTTPGAEATGPQPEIRPRTLRIEALIGIGILFASAVLASTPPPLPAQGNNQASEAPTVGANPGEYTISLSIDPGAQGINTYIVTVKRNNVPVQDAEVWVRFTVPSLDLRTRPIKLDAAGDGLYLATGAELNRVAEYSALIDVIPAGAQPAESIRVAFGWPITEGVETAGTRIPGLLNWLSAGAVLVVFGLWSGQFLRSQLSRLRTMFALQREIAVIVALVSAATIIAVIIGGIVMVNASQRLDALQNPPPRVVNPVSPVADSLLHGQLAYQENCASCHGADGAKGNPVLRDVVERRRDEEMYSAIMNGIRTMKPVPMPDQQAWDIVNYLRSAALYR